MATTVPDFKEDGLWVKQRGTSGPLAVQTRAAVTWYSMRLRATIGGSVQRRKKCYEGCYLSEEFKDFQYFAEWCQSQAGYGLDGYALDKDLISVGAKCYSPDHCVFVPALINNILMTNEDRRSAFPIGVNRHHCGRLTVRIKRYGHHDYFGLYDDIHEATAVYKAEKEAYVKEVAERYKATIDPRVYDMLVKFEV